MPVFCTERRVVDLEFLDARDRRRKANRTERQVIRGHAVDHVAHRLFTVAGRVEGERAGPPTRRGRKSRLRGGDRPWDERPEIDEVPTIERDLLYRPGRNHVAHRTGRPIDEREIPGDDHGFTPVTERQVEVAYQRPADFEGQVFEDLGLEAGRPCRDLVESGRNRGDAIAAFCISRDRKNEARRPIPHRDRDVRNDRSGGIEGAALQHRRGLRGGRRRAAEQRRHGERHQPSRGFERPGARISQRSRRCVAYLSRSNRDPPDTALCLGKHDGASGAHSLRLRYWYHRRDRGRARKIAASRLQGLRPDPSPNSRRRSVGGVAAKIRPGFARRIR